MSADSFLHRLPGNVPGKFYVDGACLDCQLCAEMAPTIFRRDDDLAAAWVYRQPETLEEVLRAEEAVRMCPCEAIFSDGDQFDWVGSPSAVMPGWMRGEAEKPPCPHCAAKPHTEGGTGH
ncbi:MAG: ferredoxin [Verrucomicrobiales bacterium]